MVISFCVTSSIRKVSQSVKHCPYCTWNKSLVPNCSEYLCQHMSVDISSTVLVNKLPAIPVVLISQNTQRHSQFQLSRQRHTQLATWKLSPVSISDSMQNISSLHFSSGYHGRFACQTVFSFNTPDSCVARHKHECNTLVLTYIQTPHNSVRYHSAT